MASVRCESHEENVQDVLKSNVSRLITLVCSSVFIGFAVVDAWSGRQFTQSDGISYIDMSDALLKHNWHLLINPL
jgi:hypothetical protein